MSRRKYFQNFKFYPVDLACYIYTTLRLKSHTLQTHMNYFLLLFFFFPFHLVLVVASFTQFMHVNRMIKQPYFISCLIMETAKAPLLCLFCLHIFTSMVSCSVEYLYLYSLIHKYKQIKIKELNMFKS